MNEPTIEKLDKLSQLRKSREQPMQEEMSKFNRARAPSIVDDTISKRIVGAYQSVVSESESESNSELDTELHNLMKDSHGKGWEQKMNESLTEQTEKMRIVTNIGKSGRARSRSWLEVKEKFIKELDQASSSTDLTNQGKGPSANPLPKRPEGQLPYATRTRSSTLPVETPPMISEPVPATTSSTSSWWEQMKNDLIVEEAEETNPLGVSQMTVQATTSASQSSSWWDDLKADLESTEGTPTTSKIVEPETPSTPSTDPIPKKHPELRPAAHSVSETVNPSNPVAKRGVLKFENGLYRGDTLVVKSKKDLTSVAHGFGSFHTSQGEFFLGQWHMGKRHGKGIKKWDDGREYCGDWELNRRSGHGMLTQPNGDLYVGEISCGFQQGHGILKCTNGERYVGEWNVNERHGFGVLHFLNGDVYAGEWKHNKKNGWGVYKYSDGRCIYGEWKDNQFVNEATNSVELKKKIKKREKARASKYDFQEDDMLPRPPSSEKMKQHIRKPSISSTDSSTEQTGLSDSSLSSTSSSPKHSRKISGVSKITPPTTASKGPKDSIRDPKPNS